jgi:prepilin-type N-terminal cleavage/methylation domain-containing protein
MTAGFTLVEMMVALGIVATLTAIAIPVGANHIYKAQIAHTGLAGKQNGLLI